MKKKMTEVLDMLAIRCEMAQLIGWEDIFCNYSENLISDIRGKIEGVETTIPAFESNEDDFTNWWYTLDDQLNAETRTRYINNIFKKIKSESEENPLNHNTDIMFIALMSTAEKSKIFLDAYSELTSN